MTFLSKKNESLYFYLDFKKDICFTFFFNDFSFLKGYPNYFDIIEYN